MQEVITFFINKLGAFFTFLGSVQIVSGVSFLHFLGALLVLMLIIHNIVLRAR